MTITGTLIILLLMMEALSWGFWVLWRKLVKSGRIPTIKFNKRRHWCDLKYVYTRAEWRGHRTPFVWVTEREYPIPEFTKNHPDELATAAVRDFVAQLINDSEFVLDATDKEEMFSQYSIWLTKHAMPDNGYAIIEDWRDQLNPAKDGIDDE
ncbi:hypothetical protein KF5_025 [Vibrio phage vB_VpaS_KF5]|uniref:Uncharacterized protein n=1 Tax=Vibrio phage vB_VpaS_KF5 TaxID=2041476 RepID=A0A384WJU9_9CAUD|nr:hypothetical protein KF5_025 [Vibrio phage vB_VpaS_KF5]